MIGHIKIDRKILNWEWYSDYKMVHLFIHLLIKANYKDNTWQGISVNRGQLITSVEKLSENTGLTTSQTRTCLNHLQNTGEIAIKTTNKYSVVTICKYDTYQSEKKPFSKQDNNQDSKHFDNQDSKQLSNTIRKQEDIKYKEGETNFNDFACYDAEEYILGNQKVFEKICIATSKKPDEVKHQLHLYHLWMAKNEKYPSGKGAVAAGIESWIHNAKSFTKTYNKQPEAKHERLPDANEIAKKYA